VLVRNDNYWGPKPAVKKITFQVISDPNSLRVALQSGEVSGVFSFPLTQSKLFDDASGVSTYYTPTAQTTFIAFPTKVGPWNDVHVRRAVAYAVDRDAVAKDIYSGHATVTNTIVPRVQMDATLGKAATDGVLKGLPDYEFSLAKAKQELAQSTHPDGFSADVPYDQTNPGTSALLQTLKSNLGSIGITLNLKPLSFANYRTQLFANTAGTLQVATYALTPGAPAIGMQLLLNPDNAKPGGLNLANYTDPAVSQLLTKFSASQDAGEQADLLHQILSKVGTDVPYAPLYYQDLSLALSNKYKWQGTFSEYGSRAPWPLFIRTAGQ
jgi:peptide/nickel transport system substrate-binding protein